MPAKMHYGALSSARLKCDVVNPQAIAPNKQLEFAGFPRRNAQADRSIRCPQTPAQQRQTGRGVREMKRRHGGKREGDCTLHEVSATHHGNLLLVFGAD
jgi:hypothetical protein